MRLRVWFFRQRAYAFCLTFSTLIFLATVYVFPKDASIRVVVYADNASLLDLPDFRYKMNSNVCEETQVYLLIFVHTAPAHFYNRETIRRTWGKVTVAGKAVRTVFLLAEIRDAKLQTILEAESRSNGDVVQGSFLDSYRNLTYKHVMGLKWVSSHCPQAKFVMKMDDDIYIDIYRMVFFLERRYPRGLSTSLGCYQQTGMSVVRDETSKWFVSKSDYPRDTFENYCSGWAYVLSPKVAEKLVSASRYFKFFWIDDVYVTGTLAKGAGLQQDPLNWIFTISTGSLLDWTRSREKKAWRYLIGPTWGDMLLMEDAHRRSKACWKDKCVCCSARTRDASVVPIVLNNGSLKGIAEIVNRLPSRS